MRQPRSIPPRAWFELFLIAVIWGASFLSIRVALDEMGVFTIVALRVLGGGAILWAYVLARGLNVPRDGRIWFAFLVMGILNNVLPFSLIAWGQLTIPSGTTAILNAATALFGVLLAAVALPDEGLTSRKLTGVVLGLAGVAVVMGQDALSALDLTSVSQLALLAAALSYALAAVWARKRLSGLPPQVAAAGMLTTSTLIMLPIALAVDGQPDAQHSVAVWAAIGYLAIFSTAIAYLLFYRVLAMAGAGNVSLCTLMATPFAILLGALVLDEALPSHAYAGFALIAAGLLVIDGRLLPRRKEAA
ncbi:MAG: EamA family transporter [Cereibacter sphaeroides]|uniref:EamA family transporter n=1 Tax=Cereibacter sphaeroides TaxID=1063 RepID=A0A2W5UCD0_CERSP|nr:MAG: EamA family transporter [Cereibacter sphaeroides]